MAPIASLSSVIQGYGSRTVLSGIDLAVHQGVLGLLGPNGAGKSTLLRTLATATPPRSGSVTVSGTTVTSEREARVVRRQVGYLPQDFGFYPSFTVQDFVEYCAWLRGVAPGEARDATRRAIEAVGLADRAGAKMKSLSGGMLRRAGIAAAVVGEPAVLLLDEPTVGLDPAQRLEFRTLLRSLPDTAIVLSTHLVEDVAAVCDRVVVMQDGRFVYDGTPGDLAGQASADAPGDSEFERGYMAVLRSEVGA
ncbi:ATP-binding cassette domain-containing protein [Kitasatospora sp. MY 5-36]|uniref:ATP-binding cassette domain-containing protein n=1 Tax=Kitasatospora sp. MY 5-36 TaxID=1678027 RepID=UPI000670D2DC|nr:ATP-binding cassette domain-containing protein [Kitasatospora sp. MY 5-36]